MTCTPTLLELPRSAEAELLEQPGVGRNRGLHHGAVPHRRHGVVDLVEGELAADHPIPREAAVLTAHHGRRPLEVREVAPPRRAEGEVGPAQGVGVEHGGAAVGVLAARDDHAALANHVERLGHGHGRTGCLDHHVRTPAVGVIHDPLLALVTRGVDTEGARGAHLGRERQSPGVQVQHQHARGARQPGERDDALSDRTGTDHHHRVTQLDLGALDGVERGVEPAPATAVGAGRQSLGQADEHGAGQQVDGLGPPAVETVTHGDAVHLAVRARRAGLVDQARTAAATRAVHVHEPDHVALLEGVAVDVHDLTPHLVDAHHGHVTRHERSNRRGVPAYPQVLVRAAHLAVQDVSLDAAGLKVRLRVLPKLNCGPYRARNDCCTNRRHHSLRSHVQFLHTTCKKAVSAYQVIKHCQTKFGYVKRAAKDSFYMAYMTRTRAVTTTRATLS